MVDEYLGFRLNDEKALESICADRRGPLVLALLATRPAAVLSESSIILNHGNTCGFSFGSPLRIYNPVLHPDIFDAYFNGFLNHSGHKL